MYIPIVADKVGDLVDWASQGHVSFDGENLQDFIDGIVQ